MNKELKYSIQLITATAQLKEVFSLRYHTYQKAYPLLTAHHAQPYEWDAFDTRSIHLGLYCEKSNGRKLVGYCRLILPQFFSNNLSSLMLSKYPSCLKMGVEATQRLAFMRHLQKPGDYKYIEALCTELEAENRLYCEASRLIIEEAHRNILLSSFFISGVFAFGKIIDLKYFFISCTHQHAPFYKKFDLELLPCEAEYGTAFQKKPQVVFGTYLNGLNLSKTPVKSLQIQMQSEGQITFYKAA